MFHRTLWYIYVFSLSHQPSPNYEDQSRTYKIQEFKYSFDNIFNKKFIPGENLILDETIICDFVCIKFKSRMVTKSDRYGIKIYVVKDAETVFVLKVIIYTSKYTYAKKYNTDMLKTVKVFCERCKIFEWLHHTFLLMASTPPLI